MLTATPSTGKTTYTYDKENRLTKISKNPTLTYDANGNLLSKKVSNNVVAAYAWDYDDMLTGATISGTNYTYAYDPLGQRVKRVAGGAETRYITVGGTVLAEMDASNNITAYYVYGMGLISKVTPQGAAYYYHYDNLGSTIAITDSSGNIINKYAYDAFGKVLSQVEGVANPFKYVGAFGVMDEGNGLLYMRARYYDPATGRFIIIDPFGLYWEYSQTSGQMTYIDNQTGARTSVGTGYAGSGEGLNNSNMQNVPFTGPIPQGTWDIGGATTTKGPLTLPLTPQQGTNIFGRNAFRIHGDNSCGCQSASQGCIILQRSIRKQINNSRDRELRVIP